jgi:hypothetical protein
VADSHLTPEVVQHARRRRTLAWAVPVAAVGALALVGGTVAATLHVTDARGAAAARSVDAQPTRAPSAWELEQQQRNSSSDSGTSELGLPAALPDELPADLPTEPEPTYEPSLVAADIKLTPKVLEKNCFGSAGCNVKIKLRMTYSGPDLSPDDTFEVTYEVRGDEDGPVVGTFEVTGSEYSVPKELLSTRSNNTKISVKVTDVEKIGV